MDATAATAAAAQNGGPGSPTLKAAPSTTAALDTSVSSAPMGEDVATLREQLAAERARRAKMNADMMRIRERVTEEVARLEATTAGQAAELEALRASHALRVEEAEVNAQLLAAKEEALAAAAREVEHAVFQRDCMKGDLDELASQVAERDATITELKEQLAEQTSARSSGATGVADTAAVEAAAAEAAKARRDATDAAAARDEALARAQAAEAEAARLTSAAAASEVTIGELRAKLAEAAASAKTAVDAVALEKAALESALASEKQAVASERLARAQLMGELLDLKAERRDVAAYRDRVLAELEAAKARIRELEAALAAAKAKADAPSPPPLPPVVDTAALAAAQGRIAQLEQQVASSDAKAAAAAKQADELRSQLEEVRADKASLAATVASLESNAAEAADNAERLQELLRSATVSEAALRGRMERALAAHAEAEADLGKATAYGRALLQANRELTAEVRDLRGALQAAISGARGDLSPLGHASSAASTLSSGTAQAAPVNPRSAQPHSAVQLTAYHAQQPQVTATAAPSDASHALVPALPLQQQQQPQRDSGLAYASQTLSSTTAVVPHTRSATGGALNSASASNLPTSTYTDPGAADTSASALPPAAVETVATLQLLKGLGEQMQTLYTALNRQAQLQLQQQPGPASALAEPAPIQPSASSVSIHPAGISATGRLIPQAGSSRQLSASNALATPLQPPRQAPAFSQSASAATGVGGSSSVPNSAAKASPVPTTERYRPGYSITSNGSNSSPASQYAHVPPLASQAAASGAHANASLHSGAPASRPAASGVASLASAARMDVSVSDLDEAAAAAELEVERRRRHAVEAEVRALQEALEAMQQGQAPAPEHDAYAYAAAQPPQPASAANLTTASAAATLRARAQQLKAAVERAQSPTRSSETASAASRGTAGRMPASNSRIPTAASIRSSGIGGGSSLPASAAATPARQLFGGAGDGPVSRGSAASGGGRTTASGKNLDNNNGPPLPVDPLYSIQDSIGAALRAVHAPSAGIPGPSGSTSAAKRERR